MLITLVIIGVVAALTIPNLMQKYQEQTTVKKVQKFYSTLSNAYSLAMKDNGNIDEWGITDINQAGAIKVYELLFKPHFKITKICGFFDNEKCKKTTRYSTLHNEQGSFLYNNVITLNDGETVVIRANAIYYDVNGLKGPNQWGRDLFGFALRGDKSFPFGIQTGKYSTKPFNTYCQKNVSLETQGMGCAAWVVYKGNMDYLHCDDLTWDSRSCKEK